MSRGSILVNLIIRFFSSVMVVAAVLFQPLPSAAQRITDGPADLILRDGKVITLDTADRVADAIAVRGNQILAVGSNAEIQGLAGPKTKTIDLRGRSVTPGFIDAHTSEHTADLKKFWVDSLRLTNGRASYLYTMGGLQRI